MSPWSILYTDTSPWCMYFLYVSFLMYSYVRKRWRILCMFYLLSSALFILRPLIPSEPIVHAWFTYKVCVVIGMACAEIIRVKTKADYMFIHVGTVIFSCFFVYDKVAGWIVMPLIYILMSLLSGYKKMTLFCGPTMILISMVSAQIKGVPFITMCTPIIGLLPFYYFFDLFPETHEYSVV